MSRKPISNICRLPGLISFAFVSASCALISFGQDVSKSTWSGIVRGQPIKLFDGKTLDGWTKQNGKPPKHWVVEDGTLYRKQRDGDLYHAHWFRDFELSFEWKILEKGNSGVKYRVQNYGRQKLGCEFQIQDDGQNPFNKHATGALYAVYEPAKNKRLNPVGSWNTAKIIVCGNRIEHWLNGEQVLTANVGSMDWLQRVQKSKFRDKEYFGQNREGRIFLQDHGHPVWYRNIILVPLDCDQSIHP